MELLPRKVTSSDDFLQLLADEAHQLTLEARSPSTVKVYMSYYNKFVQFCTENEFQSEPVTWEALVAFMADCSLKNKSLQRVETTLSAVRHFHNVCGLPTDALKDQRVTRALDGFKRRWARRKPRYTGADPVTVGDIKMLVKSIPVSLAGFRDRAMILVGFAAALRRSELVSIKVEDIDFTEDGMMLYIPFSKTDQYGEGDSIAIPYIKDEQFCPVVAVQTWMNVSRITKGALFRPINPHTYELGEDAMSIEQYVYIFNRIVGNSGINEVRFKRISTHSLRKGRVTSGLESGEDIADIMDVTRHRTPSMVLRYYKSTRKFERSKLGKMFDETNSDS